ncbi:unnamed protein product, partial [Arabidopsis halleri]
LRPKPILYGVSFIYDTMCYHLHTRWSFDHLNFSLNVMSMMILHKIYNLLRSMFTYVINWLFQPYKSIQCQPKK